MSVPAAYLWISVSLAPEDDVAACLRCRTLIKGGACCRTMAEAAKKSGQQQQEDSIRAAAEAYFERAEDAPEVPSNGISLPLSEKTGFLSKDVRMLLRDNSDTVSAGLCWAQFMTGSFMGDTLKLLARSICKLQGRAALLTRLRPLPKLMHAGQYDGT